MNRYIDGVDGLRAIAVWAVLIFHAFPNVVPGGFIGVDIFFVISGFIITKTYYDRLQSTQTTLRHFYMKRVRRLAPVYILVILLTTIAAYALLDPPLLKEYSSGLGAQPVYLQNFVFWSQGDYFASPLTRPLLHTWSLAIEEQFYLLYGLAILIARRFPKSALALIVFTTLGSFVGGHVLAVVSPKTTFFLLPARLWEFGAGFLVARIAFAPPSKAALAIRFAGLLMVAVAVGWFNEQTLFPGTQSILAVVGCGLILWTMSFSRDGAPLLGHPSMVYFGRLSYALYLWHWPIIALASTYLARNLGPLEAGIALVASWGLAHLSYHYVEEPFRQGLVVPGNRALIGLTSGLGVIFIATGVLLYQSHGAAFRYPPEMARLYRAQQVKSPYRCSYLKRIRGYPSEMCTIGTPTGEVLGSALVLGDSHADQLDEMIASEGKKRGLKVYLTTRNCTLDNYGSSQFCSDGVLDDILSEIRQKDIEYVFAIAYTSSEMSKARFTRSVEKLSQSGIRRLFLMNTVPQDPYFDPARKIEDLRAGNPPVTPPMASRITMRQPAFSGVCSGARPRNAKT